MTGKLMAMWLGAGIAAAMSVAAVASVAPDKVMIKDQSVAKPIADKPGDPANGRKIFANRKKGNCLACHANKDQKEQLFHGNIGPALDGVATRYEAAQLRAILINSKAVFGDHTIMPSFYHLGNGVRIRKKFQGKTILSAQEVEDVLAYLLTLNSQ